MNRHQRRAAEHRAKARKADTAAKQLSARAKFESGLREALAIEQIRLISMTPGREEEAESGRPTGEAFWVLTVYADGRFLSVRSSRAALADMAAGVTRAVREAIAAAPVTVEPAPAPSVPAHIPAPAPVVVEPTPLGEPLSLGERIRRAQA